jgi:ABC-type Fe3+-hydroxamate transport system substrate-binding protein
MVEKTSKMTEGSLKAPKGSPAKADGSLETAASDDLIDHSRVHSCRDELPDRAFRRIVSLVPSLSEALVVLGLSDRLVGVTEYCVHPKGAFGGLPKLGGTKDADVRAIIDLAPDLVIANHEENTARAVRRLADAGIDVWVTYPRTVREGATLLRDLAGLGAAPAAVERWVVPVERAVEVATLRADACAARPKVFCPIWRDPWMTIGRETYIHDMIELCGGENLFAQLETSADRRYPIVDLDDVVRAQPDVILLPDEPYAFDEADRKRLSGIDCPAARDAQIHLIDGTLVSWYGPRIVEAIRVLAGIFANRI